MKDKFSKLINGKEAILIDFHAEWCGPCKMIAPTIKQIALENKGRLRVVKIDIDKNKSIADRLSIKGVPTLAVFKNGELLWRQSGVMNKSQIMQAITKYL